MIKIGGNQYMDIENCNLAELKEIAKEKGVKNISKLKKEELIELLTKNENTEKPVKKERDRYKDTNEDDYIIEGI